MKMLPRFLSNVLVEFSIPGCQFAFRCKGYKIAGFEVRVCHDDKYASEIAYMVGGDQRFRMPAIYTNLLSLPDELLADLYHMARCRREMERLGPDGLGFTDFRNGFLHFEKESGHLYRQWVEDSAR